MANQAIIRQDGKIALIDVFIENYIGYHEFVMLCYGKLIEINFLFADVNPRASTIIRVNIGDHNCGSFCWLTYGEEFMSSNDFKSIYKMAYYNKLRLRITSIFNKLFIWSR